MLPARSIRYRDTESKYRVQGIRTTSGLRPPLADPTSFMYVRREKVIAIVIHCFQSNRRAKNHSLAADLVSITRNCPIGRQFELISTLQPDSPLLYTFLRRPAGRTHARAPSFPSLLCLTDRQSLRIHYSNRAPIDHAPFPVRPCYSCAHMCGPTDGRTNYY